MLRPLWLAACALFALAAGAASGTGHYRLAGIMRVGADHLGLLELPSGAQTLVRRGSVIDGATVTRLDGEELRLSFPDRTVTLRLDGGVGDSASNAALGVVSNADDRGHVSVREVQPRQMSQALAGVPPAAPAPPGRKPNAGAELGRRFAAVLDLPPNARVVAVNDQPVQSAEKALAQINRALEGNQVATLNLESRSDEAPRRVYLIPPQDRG